MFLSGAALQADTQSFMVFSDYYYQAQLNWLIRHLIIKEIDASFKSYFIFTFHVVTHISFENFF